MVGPIDYGVMSVTPSLGGRRMGWSPALRCGGSLFRTEMSA
jgi:hypothetical protein